jgi:hypothetical protein
MQDLTTAVMKNGFEILCVPKSDVRGDTVWIPAGALPTGEQASIFKNGVEIMCFPLTDVHGNTVWVPREPIAILEKSSLVMIDDSPVLSLENEPVTISPVKEAIDGPVSFEEDEKEIDVDDVEDIAADHESDSLGLNEVIPANTIANEAETSAASEAGSISPCPMSPKSTVETSDVMSGAQAEVSTDNEDDSCSDSGASVDTLCKEEFPEMMKSNLKPAAIANESKRIAVCMKPQYKTTCKLQVRDGPGSKFAAADVLPAGTIVRVLQEGIDSVDYKLLERWAELHLGIDIYEDHRRKGENETWAEYFKAQDLTRFLKIVRGSDLKVNVAYVNENGEEQSGWISRKKKKSPTMIRLMNGVVPVVVLDNLESFSNKFNDSFTQKQQAQTGRFKIAPIAVLRSELKSKTGCARLEWNGDFVLNRSKGMDTEQVRVWNREGTKKIPVVRTGFYRMEKSALLYFKTFKQAQHFLAHEMDADLEACGAEFEFNYANLAAVSIELCPEYKEFQRVEKQLASRMRKATSLGQMQDAQKNHGKQLFNARIEFIDA